MIRDVAFSAPFMVLEIFDICHNMEKWHSTALEKQNCPTSHDICQHEVCEDLQEKIILLGNIKLDLDYTWKRLGNESLYQRYGLENTYKRGGNGSVYWRYAYEWHSDEVSWWFRLPSWLMFVLTCIPRTRISDSGEMQICHCHHED